RDLPRGAQARAGAGLSRHRHRDAAPHGLSQGGAGAPVQLPGAQRQQHLAREVTRSEVRALGDEEVGCCRRSNRPFDNPSPARIMLTDRAESSTSSANWEVRMKSLVCAAIGAIAFLASGPALAQTTLTIATVNNGDMIRMQGLTGEFTAKNPGIAVKCV